MGAAISTIFAFAAANGNERRRSNFLYPTSGIKCDDHRNNPASDQLPFRAVLYLDHSREYIMVDVDKAVRKSAGGREKTEISGIAIRKSLRFHASGLKTEPGC